MQTSRAALIRAANLDNRDARPVPVARLTWGARTFELIDASQPHGLTELWGYSVRFVGDGHCWNGRNYVLVDPTRTNLALQSGK